MASPFGQSFAPTDAASEETKKLSPAQQAIQVLSMRLPRVRGARSISPYVGESRSAAAMQQGGFSPESAVLQTLMQAQRMSAPEGSMPGAASPSMGASDPMAAAMAALGGGMMNAAPSAPVVTPGIADPNRPLPPIVPAPAPTPEPAPAPWAPLPPNVVPGDSDDRGFSGRRARDRPVEAAPRDAPTPMPTPQPYESLPPGATPPVALPPGREPMRPAGPMEGAPGAGSDALARMLRDLMGTL